MHKNRTNGSVNMPGPLFLNTHNGSGFSPLRSPSRLVTMDDVQYHLRDFYHQQLSNFINLWSNLKNGGISNQNGHQNSIFPISEFLIKSDDGRIVDDFSKELLEKASFGRRYRLSGEFGCGKTSLFYSLISIWCTENSELCEIFPILLYLRSEYAYGRQSFEDVLQNILPTAELKFVMKILNDRLTRNQVLILLDDCQNFNGFYKNEDDMDSKAAHYALDMNRLLKGLYLPETMVVFAGSEDHDSFKRNFVNYVVHGMRNKDDHVDYRNPLLRTLESILDDQKSTGQRDTLFSGIEKATTILLAKMECPTNMTYDDCIRILGLLSLMTCHDYLPPLTLESRRMINQKMELFRHDQKLRNNVDDLLKAAVDCGLLITPGTGRTRIALDESSIRSKNDYILAFVHRSFALYLASRTFVSLNLNIDWSRIQNRHRSRGDFILEPNERYMFYFLTGIDGEYIQQLITRSIHRHNGSDHSLILPWTVADVARKYSKSITVYADDKFTIVGSKEYSDSILLNTLSIFYRSTTDNELQLDTVLLRDEFKHDGSSISTLRFRNCSIYDRFLRFSSGRLFDRLVTLELLDCQFHDCDVISALSDRLSSIPSLISLNIVRCQKLVESIDFMRSLGNISNLHILQISDVKANERSREAALELAKSMEKFAAIKRLILIKNDVIDTLFPAIISHLNLEDLDLSHCQLENPKMAWQEFVDIMIRSEENGSKKTLICLKLDGNISIMEILGLKEALKSCSRLKTISMKDCFRTPMDGQWFKEAMRQTQTVYGLHRDVII